MANEISVTSALSVFKASAMSSPVGRSLANFIGTWQAAGGEVYVQGVITSLTFDPVAVPLGSIVNPHWAFFYNPESTVSACAVHIHNGITATPLLSFYGGEGAVVPLAIAAIPYVSTNLAGCEVEYLIFER